MIKYYFAYGSNMNKDRMIERGIKFTKRFSGKVKGWKLVFQKFTTKGTYANIIEDKSSTVEGVVYKVNQTVKKLDKFEHVPTHYLKKELIIKTTHGDLSCLVYIGNKKNTGRIGKPKKEYMSHLLKGRIFLTEKYFHKLNLYNSKLK